MKTEKEIKEKIHELEFKKGHDKAFIQLSHYACASIRYDQQINALKWVLEDE